MKAVCVFAYWWVACVLAHDQDSRLVGQIKDLLLHWTRKFTLT